nr:MAG TPA: hypothetical protein [Caudoviricetes sp.]
MSSFPFQIPSIFSLKIAKTSEFLFYIQNPPQYIKLLGSKVILWPLMALS